METAKLIEKLENLDCLDLNEQSEIKKYIKLFSEEKYSIYDNIVRACSEKKIKYLDSLCVDENKKLFFKCNFEVSENWKVFLFLELNPFEKERKEEWIVLLNGINKYRGYNSVAAEEEILSLLSIGVERRKTLKDQLKYRVGVFKVKYLESFKKLFSDSSIDKYFIEFIINNLKLVNVFASDGLVRAIYKFFSDDITIDILLDDACRLSISGKDGEKCYVCSDMAVCIKEIYNRYKNEEIV